MRGFTVQAERRLWVHVAIDRLTGQVLDTQVEVPAE
jgi:very-short-patch-repair endonuclease